MDTTVLDNTLSRLPYYEVLNSALLNILSCPLCHGELGPLSVEDTREMRLKSNIWIGDANLTSAEFLTCSCKAAYPVIDGVPRLLEGAAMLQSVQSCTGKMEGVPGAPDVSANSLQKEPDDFDRIRESFSREWEVFDYATDKTWGWTLEERKKIFLDDVGFSAERLSGKTVLDAGCGNGTLTAALSTLAEMDVVGVDLNEGLGQANCSKTQYAGNKSNRVSFVQGNLFNPPFKSNSFDLIYCSGVIHHTPNSRKTFKKLVPLMKKGGRLYVWVYGKRSLLLGLFVTSARQLKRVMSLRSLLRVCGAVAPAYKVGTELLDACGVMPFRQRTVREITLDLFDAWAPQYNHAHTVEEVMHWFREAGFSNVTASGKQKHGFGVYGDKI